MPASKVENDHQRFDQWSDTYERSFLQRLIFDRVHRAVINRLPEAFTPTFILDIGCGTGRLLRRMNNRWPGASLVGVDQSEGMVNKARQLTPAATIYQASAEHLPVEDQALDLVTTTMSFHHWSDQTQGVRETFRVLRPGAYFVLADTNIGHGSPLTRSQVKALLMSAMYTIYSQTSVLPLLTITIGKKS